MYTVFDSTHMTVAGSRCNPILDSYDSAEEFSLYHWLEVRGLVDEEDASIGEDEISGSEELEHAAQDAVSEVEPAAAYQDFAGNVV